jgi:hypothetical protein
MEGVLHIQTKQLTEICQVKDLYCILVLIVLILLVELMCQTT